MGAHVRLDVVVVSPALIECALAPTPGAAIRWTLLYEQEMRAGNRRTGERHLRPFASGWHVRGPLVCRDADGKTIAVPLEHASLRAMTDPSDGSPVGGSPASSARYAGLAARAPSGAGMTFVREHVIAHGQRLRLHAFVQPRAGVSGVYREAAGHDVETDFVATREVVLEDVL